MGRFGVMTPDVRELELRSLLRDWPVSARSGVEYESAVAEYNGLVCGAGSCVGVPYPRGVCWGVLP